MNQNLPRSQIFFIIVFVLISFTCQSQTRLSDIDTTRIKQKSIRILLKNQIGKGLVNFEDFRPSVDEKTDSSQFEYYESHYFLPQTQATAWNAYLTIHPAKVWQSKVISYGFIYSPVQKSVIFSDDTYPGLEPGQLFFLEFRLISGLVRFPICLLVTQIDRIKHEISFSYIESGPSKGSQTIRLENAGSNETKIIHSSIHKPKTFIRDRIFYPIYHRKAVNEIHRNIRKLID